MVCYTAADWKFSESYENNQLEQTELIICRNRDFIFTKPFKIAQKNSISKSRFFAIVHHLFLIFA